MPRQPHMRIHFNIQNPGRQPAVDQIVGSIKTQIQTENVASGSRLPPVRVLAHQLGISKNTVQKAYDELSAQGLVESKNRVGLFIAPKPKSISINARQLVSAPALKLPPPSQITGPKIPNPINLSAVFIDLDLLPAERLESCFRAAIKQPGLREFYSAYGYLPLRKKIAERLNKRGIEADPEHIVITAGAQQALDVVCRVLQNKTIATENPAYGIGKQLFEMSNFKSVGLPIDPFQGVDLNRWEKT